MRKATLCFILIICTTLFVGCVDKEKKEAYGDGMNAYFAEDYEKAIELFKLADDHEDAAAFLEKSKENLATIAAELEQERLELEIAEEEKEEELSEEEAKKLRHENLLEVLVDVDEYFFDYHVKTIKPYNTLNNNGYLIDGMYRTGADDMVEKVIYWKREAGGGVLTVPVESYDINKFKQVFDEIVVEDMDYIDERYLYKLFFDKYK